jgi:hypothetical protein
MPATLKLIAQVAVERVRAAWWAWLLLGALATGVVVGRVLPRRQSKP